MWREHAKSPTEELDMQSIDNPRWKPFQFLTSLLLVRRGWFANPALQRPRHGAGYRQPRQDSASGRRGSSLLAGSSWIRHMLR